MTDSNKNSPKQSLTALVSELILQTEQKFPGNTVPRKTLIVYAQEWTDLALKAGWKRFSKAVKAASQECFKFPTLADIKNRLDNDKIAGEASTYADALC